MECEIFFLDAFDPLRKSDVEGALVIAGRENAPVHFVLADSLEENEPKATPLERKQMLEAYFGQAGLPSVLRLFPFSEEGEPLSSLVEKLRSKKSDHPILFLVKKRNCKSLKEALTSFSFRPSEILCLNEAGRACLRPSEVPEALWPILEKKRLYYVGKLESLLQSGHRLLHSISVANLCYEIAKGNGLEKPEKAYEAGLFHDVGKHLDEAQERSIMEEKYPPFASFPRWAFHQFTGAYLAKKEFGIEDEDILEAIRFHATGKKDMSPLGKIVYSADKIDPLRDYDSSEMIALCLKDYRKGFLKVLHENRVYLTGKGYKVDNPLTKECFDYYLGE